MTAPWLAPQFAGSALIGYFVADCRELMTTDISLWIAGHTHGSFNLQDEASGIPLVCNPHGYHQDRQRENPDFNPVATIRVE